MVHGLDFSVTCTFRASCYTARLVTLGVWHKGWEKLAHRKHIKSGPAINPSSTENKGIT